MAVRVSPTEPRPTHDISLTDRKGKTIGLILSDANGARKQSWQRPPVDRTSFKTSSGNSQYSDLEYPYSPIVQDDWSGGRGGLDFERDGTKFYDSYRMRTSRANKAFLGPQEQMTSGNRKKDEMLPGNVKWVTLSGSQLYIAKRFQSSDSYTAAAEWVLARVKRLPNDMHLAIYSDNAGLPNASVNDIAVPSTRMNDSLSEWLDETISKAITTTTYYWIVVYTTAVIDNVANHWELGVKPASGTTYTSPDGHAGSWVVADFDLYFRLTDAAAERRCIFLEYKELLYAFLSASSGAPQIFKQGDRGAAQSNAGQMSNVVDAAKAWTVNQWAGCVVKIVAGLGQGEITVYRTIVSNDATHLVCDSPWTIQHDITTEYVILGSNTWTEIAGHTLAAPVTDLIISTTGVIYVGQGDTVLVKRLRAFNDAGTWRDFGDALCHADEAAGTYASYMTYQPQACQLVFGVNRDASSDVSVKKMGNTAGTPAVLTVPDWGTPLTWNAPVKVGSRYRRMRRLECYPDAQGFEACYVGKEDMVWVVPGPSTVYPYTVQPQPYPLNIREMESVKSDDNFVADLVHNVYLFFPIGNGVERYYNGQIDDIGPNVGEGLPIERRGPVTCFAGYPGKFFMGVDAGATGYSTVMMRDGNGQHEHYRGAKGQRIRGLTFQTVPGPALDRLWLYIGNDFMWLPFPSGDTNELHDPAYRYTNEGAMVLSRMHAGMFDIQKVASKLKAWSQQMQEDVCWIEMDYRLDADEAWSEIPIKFQDSPISQFDMREQFGMTASQYQLRVRFYTTDASKTPILSALILEAVMRISVKFMRPLTVALWDRARCLDGSRDDEPSAFAKQAQLDLWASDKSEGMLMMHSRSQLFDNQLVFLNPIATTHVRVKNPRRHRDRNALVCVTSVQDA